MKRFLKFIVYGPTYEENKSLLREAARRREASPYQGVRDNARLKSFERGMGIFNVLILWAWRFTTASAVLAIVLLSLGL